MLFKNLIKFIIRKKYFNKFKINVNDFDLISEIDINDSLANVLTKNNLSIENLLKENNFRNFKIMLKNKKEIFSNFNLDLINNFNTYAKNSKFDNMTIHAIFEDCNEDYSEDKNLIVKKLLEDLDYRDEIKKEFKIMYLLANRELIISHSKRKFHLEYILLGSEYLLLKINNYKYLLIKSFKLNSLLHIDFLNNERESYNIYQGIFRKFTISINSVLANMFLKTLYLNNGESLQTLQLKLNESLNKDLKDFFEDENLEEIVENLVLINLVKKDGNKYYYTKKGISFLH